MLSVLRNVLSAVPNKVWVGIVTVLFLGFTLRGAYFDYINTGTSISLQKHGCNQDAITAIKEIKNLPRSEQFTAIEKRKSILSRCAKNIDPDKPIEEVIFDVTDEQITKLQ